MAGHSEKYMRLCFRSLLFYIFVGSVTSAVIISEVSDKGTSNSCPDRQDWIELQNTGKKTVFLDGFKLHDDKGPDHSKAYMFASNAKIESGGFLVLCTRVDDKSPQFKIGGEDTITLRDAAGVVVSTSGALQDQGEFDATWAFNTKTAAFEYTYTPTPGRKNVFTDKWSQARAQLTKYHEDGEAFFESNSVRAAERFPPVVELRLTMSAADWAYQQANASYELYKPFTGLEVTSKDGKESHAKLSAGGRARPRGQSTNTIPLCLGLKTFPWLIDVAGGSDSSQRLFGMQKFYLRTHLGDPSYMREWTMHRMLRRFDLPYLRTRTAKLYINGEYTGLYEIMEAPDQDYVFYRNFGVDKTNTTSTKPPFGEGYAMYKVKTHAIGCGEETYETTKELFQISWSDVEARRKVDPKHYNFVRGEHRTRVTALKPEELYKCGGIFFEQLKGEFIDAMAAWEKSGKNCGKMALDYGRVERDIGDSDPDTDNNDRRMIDFFNAYLANDAFGGCGDDCDASTGPYASLRVTPKVDIDQWLRNFAVYAVTVGQDTPIGNGNNYFLASPGGSSEAERAYRIVQYDHNGAMTPSGSGLCSSECGSIERTLYWSIARPTCKSLKTNPSVGPLLAGEGNKDNMKKYLGYVKEFNEKVFTNASFIAITENHARAISVAAKEDPAAIINWGYDFENELSASAGNWEKGHLLAFMKARGAEVKKQIDAIESGQFPRMDEDVPMYEKCQDWRLETPSTGTYEEDGKVCHEEHFMCREASQCFDESATGKCDAATGQFKDTEECNHLVSTYCKTCFPYSACGLNGDAKGKDTPKEPKVKTSATYEEDGKVCTPDHAQCAGAYMCFDESDDGQCDAATGQFKNTKWCNDEVSTHCRGCFPYSACGSRIACRKCGTTKQGDQLSCCARGGSWFKNCGDDKQKFDHTWLEGIEACKAPSATQPAVKATMAPKVGSTISPVCQKCVKNKKTGNPSCCAPGGAWFKNCGNDSEKFDHTWTEGIKACKNFEPTISSVCSKCAKIKKSGLLSCCARGGEWFKQCGTNNDKFDHTWKEGIEACRKDPVVTKSTAKPIVGSGCPSCGRLKEDDQLSCCARGGTWFNKCGKDKEKSEHTWFEGIKACKVVVEESLAAQEQQFGYSDNSESNSIARDDLDGVVVTAGCQGFCKLTYIGAIVIGTLLVGSQIQM